MSPKPPPAPSKNALRILRQLALGGSTAIGAIGSICGVATLSYDVHRRIRLAEQVLDTKKKLRSISNGAGASHIARMCKAAENGEDFGIAVSRKQKRRNIGTFSVPEQDWPQSTHVTDWTKTLLAEWKDGMAPDASYALKRTAFEKSASQRIQEATIAVSKQPLHNVFRRTIRRSRNQDQIPAAAAPAGAGRESRMSVTERIKAATQQQHKLHSHAVFGRPNKPKLVTNWSLPECVDRWLKPEGGGNIQYQECRHHLRVTSGLKQSSSREHQLHPFCISWKRFSGVSSPVSEGPSAFRGLMSEPFTIRRTLFEPSAQPWNRRYFSVLSTRMVKATHNPVSAPTSTKAPGPEERKRPSTTQQGSENGDEVVTDDTGLEKSWIRPWSSFPSGIILNLGSETRHPQPPNPDDDIDRSHLHTTSLDLQQVQSAARKSDINPPDEAPGRDIDKSVVSLQKILMNTAFVPENHHVDLGKLDFDASRFAGVDSSFIEEHLRQAAEGRPQLGGFSLKTSLSSLISCVKKVKEAIEKQGPTEAEKLWINYMWFYAGPGNSQDMEMVKLLLHQFSGLRGLSFYFRPIRLLARYLLEKDRHSAEAAELLFTPEGLRMSKQFIPSKGFGTITTAVRERVSMKNAVRYVEHFCNEEADTRKIVSEFRKVVGAAKRRGFALTEGLFVSVLRHLAQKGEMTMAQIIFDEMAYYHRIRPTFFSRAVMLQGYAYIGEWARLEQDFEMLHHDGWSRLRPFGYTLLFNSVFRRYAECRSVEQTHDFLIHAVSYWGLVPTSAVTSTAIMAFLAQKRYDLIRQWVQTVRVLFPQIESDTSIFAWQLGDTWERINATCQDVENACRALIVGRRAADSIHPGTMVVARETIARNLASKLHTADMTRSSGGTEGDFDYDGHPLKLTNSENFDQYLNQVLQTIPTEGDKQAVNKHTTTSALELRVEVESAARLNSLFAGVDDSNDHFHTFAPVRHVQRVPKASNSMRLQSEFPPELLEEFLPHQAILYQKILKYYMSRALAGQPIQHEIIKYVCEKLARRDRDQDATEILARIFSSPFVQPPNGVMFELGIMEHWLHMALKMRSCRHYFNVLWGVLDAPIESLRITRKFLLLARITAVKLNTHRFVKPVHDEEGVRWLWKRLVVRADEQDRKCLQTSKVVTKALNEVSTEDGWKEYNQGNESTKHMPV